MFRFHRTARISRGKFPEASQWAKGVAEYISATYAPVSVQAYVELFGDVGTIHWYADYEDLAGVGMINAKLMADPDYQARVAKAADLFVEGSIHDTLMQAF